MRGVSLVPENKMGVLLRGEREREREETSKV